MEAKITQVHQKHKPLLSETDVSDSFTKKVKEKNQQLKNLLKTNLELLKLNDINSMLLF